MPDKPDLTVSCQRCGGRTFTIGVVLPDGIVVRCCGCGLTVPTLDS